MNNKAWLFITGALVVIIVLLSFCIHDRNLTIDKLDSDNLRLKEQKNQLSFEFEKIDLRRIRRDSLAKTQNKVYDEQIRLLDAANDSTVKRVVLSLLPE